MTDQITGKQFDGSTGVEDWRALWGGGFVCAYFQMGSFAAGAALVQAISDLEAAADHHIDVDLRSEGVTVRLFTYGPAGLISRATRDPGGLSSRDVELAREISTIAHNFGISADSSVVQ